jgi:hypothetical protein
MGKLIPVIAGALVVGAASLLGGSKSAPKTRTVAARSKAAKKRATPRSGTTGSKRKAARKRS